MNGHDAAKLFRDLAERLERNPPEEFSGAFLIVPPGDGEPIDGLSVATKPNAVVFWTTVSGQLDLAISEYKAREQQMGGGFRR